tara:strand:+ start:15751 stop:16479 length:729 start_codon:yes stop_codon:yes gene_type:complete
MSEQYELTREDILEGEGFARNIASRYRYGSHNLEMISEIESEGEVPSRHGYEMFQMGHPEKYDKESVENKGEYAAKLSSRLEPDFEVFDTAWYIFNANIRLQVLEEMEIPLTGVRTEQGHFALEYDYLFDVIKWKFPDRATEFRERIHEEYQTKKNRERSIGLFKLKAQIERKNYEILLDGLVDSTKEGIVNSDEVLDIFEWYFSNYRAKNEEDFLENTHTYPVDFGEELVESYKEKLSSLS